MNGANQLEFVDTHILVYAHDISAGQKHDKARRLVQSLWERRAGCLNVQVLQEFYVIVTQKVAIPLTPPAASQIIADLATWSVHRPGVADVLDAIRVQDRYQISFWDAMIIVSAMQLDCATIWSEDMNPGQVYDSVKVLNPFV